LSDDVPGPARIRRSCDVKHLPDTGGAAERRMEPSPPGPLSNVPNQNSLAGFVKAPKNVSESKRRAAFPAVLRIILIDSR